MDTVEGVDNGLRIAADRVIFFVEIVAVCRCIHDEDVFNHDLLPRHLSV